jgi:prepilin-type N-terminal cleavage/methylation domain-containing protein
MLEKNEWAESAHGGGVMLRSGGRQKGFTLVEALVVVGIIGIIVAVSIPSLRRSRMRAAMLDTVRIFQTATAVSRINAIKRGTNVCLRVLSGGGGKQQLGSFRAWFDDNGNEVEDAGEELIGNWQIRNVDEWTFEDSPDAGRKMHILNQTGGGTDRGIVYLPNGMAMAELNQQAGIGEGSFEYYIFYDSLKWNRFQITVFGGAGTVEVLMWNPNAGAFDRNFAHWEYY